MRITKYMEEMLMLSRERHRDNKATNRWGDNPCPFCVADEDAHWFNLRETLNLEDSERPERMPGPHCQFCPMLSLFYTESNPNEEGDYMTVQHLMDDCVDLGKTVLELWEERLEDL